MTAPARPTATRIDRLMEDASRALADCRYFEAEARCLDALDRARRAGDFERMARIVLPLQEARRQRVQIALDAAPVRIVDHVEDPPALEPGPMLLRPPLVGADARRLRLAAQEAEVPVLVVCREPTTDLGLVPIVAITQGLTVRTRVEPPAHHDQPDLPWLVEALEALGDAAIESVDATMVATRRVDALLARLDAIPEHEKLHQALGDACREAARPDEG